MRQITNLLLLSSVLTSFAIGCGGNPELLKATEDYAAKACECKDADCIAKAADEYNKTIQPLSGKATSESEAKKIGELTAKITECTTKAAMAGVPGAP